MNEAELRANPNAWRDASGRWHVMPSRFRVDDLQAVEPDELGEADEDNGLTITIGEELDSMGFHRVSVEGPTREGVIEYVRVNWGDDDAGWFREYVVDRVYEVAAMRER